MRGRPAQQGVKIRGASGIAVPLYGELRWPEVRRQIYSNYAYRYNKPHYRTLVQVFSPYEYPGSFCLVASPFALICLQAAEERDHGDSTSAS